MEFFKELGWRGAMRAASAMFSGALGCLVACLVAGAIKAPSTPFPSAAIPLGMAVAVGLCAFLWWAIADREREQHADATSAELAEVIAELQTEHDRRQRCQAQRAAYERAMADVGYAWHAEKDQLVKIEAKNGKAHDTP